MTAFYTTVKADLLAARRGFIIHGCNDKGVMGSGVARGVKTRFPGAFTVYDQAHQRGQLKIGTCTFYQEHLDLWIANGVTQTLGVPDPLSYQGLYECFQQTLTFMIALEAARGLPYGTLPLLFPKIGAARGGGDWKVIDKLIDTALEEAQKVYGPREAILHVVDQEPGDCR
jgi:O-acetyl-ADP-ribose deacetylase (regulator of RNase III)